MSIIEKLAAGGHLSPEQVEALEKRANELAAEISKDPELMAKLSSTQSFWEATKGSMKSMLPALAASAIFGVGMGAANSLIAAGKAPLKKAVEKVQHGKRLDKMLDANPDLKREDQTKVRAHFATLHRFNPDYADDPMVAGEYVKQNLAMEGINFNTVKSIVDARKALTEARAKESPATDTIFQVPKMPSIERSELTPSGEYSK